MIEGPNELERMGYSLADAMDRTEWRALVLGIMEKIKGHETEILFHGAAESIVDAILNDGMMGTDASWGMFDRDDDPHCEVEGSFYGTVQTAAAYAEDSAAVRRPGDKPALLAVLADRLIEYCDLLPDAATVDFPLNGLTRLDDEEIAENWAVHGAGKDWREGLHDLGAVVALHVGALPPELFVRIERIEDFEAMLDAMPARSLKTPAA